MSGIFVLQALTSIEDASKIWSKQGLYQNLVRVRSLLARVVSLK